MTSPGRQRKFHDQVYLCIGIEPYTRVDGSTTKLALWRSACAECGRPFICRAPATARRFEPNRRCKAHQQPGVRVGPRPERRKSPAPPDRSVK